MLDTNFGKQNLGLNLGANDLLPGLKKGLTEPEDRLARPRGHAAQGRLRHPGQRRHQGRRHRHGGLPDGRAVGDQAAGLRRGQGGQARPPGCPTVKVETGKPATITIPKGAKPPTKTVGQLLIEGAGAKVQAGQTIRVTYTGALWKDGSIFDSSANSPEKYFETVIGKQQVIKAWDAQLVGKTVGSRVLMVVPPADGYGAAGSPPKISGTDTLVFVVDILAAY